MVTVRLTRTVHRRIGWGSNDAEFERVFELPFAPYPGLWIIADNDFQEQIEEVVFDAVRGEFSCSCGNRRVMTDRGDGDALFETLVKEQLDNGWLRRDTEDRS